MFQKPNPRQNFFELEQQILSWWKEQKILEKSINNRPEDSVRTFYDGPITANGEPHHGHMLTFAMKDLIPRYWTMKGYRVSRSLGWDCQGIPVEYEIEKKLGFKEKKDIEKYGIAEFNKLCRESVEKYQGAIVELEELMGRLTNSEEEYATMDKDFIESIWWSLKELYEKGLLYEGFKVVPYSTRAGTTLSNAEVALGGYKSMIDPAITVKFELKNEPKTYILAWTTTPWTIPTNLGLAVGKDIDYVKVKSSDSDETYIIAKDRIKEIFKDAAVEIVGEMKGTDLIGKEYNAPFDFFTGRDKVHMIYDGSHVTTDTGTGIVHLAPYGEEDNEIFQKVGIQSFDALDEQGDFNNLVPKYEKLNYRDANPVIIEDLTKLGLLFAHEEYEHEMPMCWRTKTPLIYKPIVSWYIAVSTLRDKLVANNNKINWTPEHVKEGRFGNWLAEIKDWGISRLRYWGTPLPIWKSESGKIKFIGSYAEIEELTGMKVEDPHKPFIDEFEFEFDGEKYKRIPDVIDVWYDSGAMPFARFHYPFENKEKFDQKFPADYIAESVDQTRGWFYSLHAIATCLFDSNAFKNIVMSGFVLDEDGQKLSKSKGNYTSPKPMIENHGADTIRLNFFSTPISSGEDTTIVDRTLKIQKQETILPLWNIYSYFTTYANIQDWDPREELAYNQRNVTTDSHPWDHIPFDNVDNNLDVWILMRLQETIKDVTTKLDKYQIPKATKAIKNLIDDTSKWYIRRSRDRFANGEISAIETLYYVLVETIKLLAPFAPFITEFMYKELVAEKLTTATESIHMSDYPEADARFLDQYSRLPGEMKIIRSICEMGNSLRTTSNLKLRQPLSKLEVVNTNTEIPELVGWMKDIIAEELNVKEVVEVMNINKSDTMFEMEDTGLNIKIGLESMLDPKLMREGMYREFVRNIQALRKKQGMNFGDTIVLELHSENSEVTDMLKEFENDIKQTVSALEVKVISKENATDLFKEVNVNDYKVLVNLIRQI